MQTLQPDAEYNNNNNNKSGTVGNSRLKYYMPVSSSLNLLNKVTVSDLEDMKIQIYYAGIITVIYFKDEGYVELDKFRLKIKEICKFEDNQPFTLKWVDEEGEPCTVSDQMELDEAIRLYYLNKERELVLHVFANVPQRPGLQCVGEDRSIYRRGARRWRKIYLVNGHKYQAKRFARTALCKVCQDRIWGLGRQGYKCLECKIMVHKRCHKFITLECNEIINQQHTHSNLQAPIIVDRSKITSEQTNSYGSLKKEFESRLSLKVKNNQGSPSNSSRIPETTSNNVLSSLSNNKQHNTATSPQSLISKSSSSMRRSKSSFNATSAGGKSQAHSPLSQTSNNIIPISYNELEVNDNLNESDDIEMEQESISKSFTSNNRESKRSIRDKKTPEDSHRVKKRQMGLDDFELIKVIGRGSYAKVFLVEYRKTQKCYAMKVIKKSLVNDDEDIDWVQTEKHVFEQATNHPFLVGLHSCFQTESRLFFVIEYLCGGDLMYHMQRKRKLPEDQARFYSSEIMLALDYLHSKGIIYRDLKLDNVLLDIEGHVKLTDYGMCKEGLKRGEQTSTFCGTPNYIAPEMLRGENYDFSVDWWALGVLMYEMMAGRSPFEINENPSENPDLNTEDHLFQIILEKPIRIPRSLSVKASSILKGFLQKNPAERIGTQDGLNEIKQHTYFKSIDWQLLEQRLIQPPYKPQVTSERDLNNIDELFTKEEVTLTPVTPATLARLQQNEFEGFEYVNPLILSEEFPV